VEPSSKPSNRNLRLLLDYINAPKRVARISTGRPFSPAGEVWLQGLLLGAKGVGQIETVTVFDNESPFLILEFSRSSSGTTIKQGVETFMKLVRANLKEAPKDIYAGRLEEDVGSAMATSSLASRDGGGLRHG